MAATFGRNRAPTDRYHVEPITTQFHATLLAATVPLKEYLFEQEIVKRLGRLSFQDPETVAEGLSLIWDEKQKCAMIAGAIESRAEGRRRCVESALNSP